MQRLRRRNFAALQDIDLGNGTDATGLILSEDDHKSANGGHVFDQADRALEAYDPSIRDNDNNAVRLRQEKTWTPIMARNSSWASEKRAEISLGENTFTMAARGRNRPLVVASSLLEVS